MQPGDVVRDRQANDATITFANSPAQTINVNGFGIVEFNAGEWSNAEIIDIDIAVANLHRHTGNTRLLKLANSGELTFQRIGNQLTVLPNNDQIGGWNAGNGTITFTNMNFFDATLTAADIDLRLWGTVYHEIGHNWDDPAEHRAAGVRDYATAFRGISGWRCAATRPTVNHVASAATGDDWWYLNTAQFARAYGRWNPLEDYATTWETYFWNRYHATTNGNTVVSAKHENLDRLFAEVRLLV